MHTRRRAAVSALTLAGIALAGVGCSSGVNRASKPMPCNPTALRYSAGVGDSIGSTSFHQPMVIAYYEAAQSDPGTAFAAVPTD